MIITVAGCWSFDPSRFKWKIQLAETQYGRQNQSSSLTGSFYQCYTFASHLPVDITLKSINYELSQGKAISHLSQSWEQFFNFDWFALINSWKASKLQCATRSTFAYLDIHYIKLITTFTPQDSFFLKKRKKEKMVLLSFIL